MSLGIIRFANGDSKRLCKETNPAFEDYCLNHGFSFIYKEDIDTQGRNDSWGKILILKNEIKNFDFLLWVDSDVLLLKKEFNALNELEKFDSSKHFFVARDVNGINCGVFALRNSEYSKELLDKVWLMDEFSLHCWSEQAAFMELENNFLLNRIEYLDQKVWNAYKYELYGMERDEGQVDKNSFLLHLPGLDNDKRLEVIRSFGGE